MANFTFLANFRFLTLMGRKNVNTANKPPDLLIFNTDPSLAYFIGDFMIELLVKESG